MKLMVRGNEEKPVVKASKVVKNPGRDGGDVLSFDTTGKPQYSSDKEKNKPGLSVSVGPKGSKVVTHRGVESKPAGAGLLSKAKVSQGSLKVSGSTGGKSTSTKSEAKPISKRGITATSERGPSSRVGSGSAGFKESARSSGGGGKVPSVKSKKSGGKKEDAKTASSGGIADAAGDAVSGAAESVKESTGNWSEGLTESAKGRPIPGDFFDADSVLSEFKEGNAKGYKEARIAEAEGAVARFKAIAVEHAQSPEITRARLYLEAVSDLISRVRLTVVDEEVGIVNLKSLGGAEWPPAQRSSEAEARPSAQTTGRAR